MGLHRFLVACILLVPVLLTQPARSQWIDVKDGSGSVEAFVVKGGKIFAGTSGGILVSMDEGSTWSDASAGLTNKVVQTLFLSGSNLFAGTQGGVFRSTDEGANWIAVNSGLTEGTFVNDFVYALAQVGSTLFAGTSPHGVYASNDGGTSWSPATSGIEIPEINALATIGSTLFAGTMEGGVYRSTDNGGSWQQCNSGLTATQVEGLVAIGNTLFAGTPSNGAFRSTNGGGSWTAINSGLTAAHGVNNFGASGGTVFALNDDGFYISNDNGNTWTQKNDGFTTNVRMRAVGVTASNAFCGGFWITIWKRPLTELTVQNGVEAHGNTSSSTRSITAYPNPLSSGTTIHFTSERTGAAQIVVRNLLGAEITTLFSGQLEAGEHSFIWDAIGAAPGTYECVVRIGGEVKQVGMLVRR